MDPIMPTTSDRNRVEAPASAVREAEERSAAARPAPLIGEAGGAEAEQCHVRS